MRKWELEVLPVGAKGEEDSRLSRVRSSKSQFGLRYGEVEICSSKR